MDFKDWLYKALEELTTLVPGAQHDSADAWRATTLVARLLGSPVGPNPPATIVRQLPVLIAVAGMPDAQEILDAVADGLESEADPWGPLLDGLIDADDALGVLVLAGHDDMARELSDRVAALVSLYPERIIPLGSFAQMRLQTVRDDSVVADLWRVVERAPAQVLVEALPSSTRRHRSTRPPMPIARPVSLMLPTQVYRAAAESTTSEETVEIETHDPDLKAWVYREKGLMRLEVRGLSSPLGSAAIVAERLVDGVELSRVDVEFEILGETAYASLGPWSGPTNLLHKLVASSGVSPDRLRVRVMVANG